jgi:hypothetical protein
MIFSGDGEEVDEIEFRLRPGDDGKLRSVARREIARDIP